MKKIIIIIIIFTFTAQIMLFSQDIYKRIDGYVVKKDTSGINTLLKQNKDKDDYSKIEQYVVDKAKEQMIAGDFIYAKEILKVVLENNLNNVEVQDIFLTIDEQISEQQLDEKKAKQELEQKNKDLAKREKERQKKEQEIEKQREQKRKIEEAKKDRIRKEKEKQELELAKKELQEQKEAEKKERIAEKENKKAERKEKVASIIPSFGLNNFSLSWEFGAVDFLFYQSMYHSDFYGYMKPNFKYGINTGISFYCHLPFIVTGIDFDLETYFAGLNTKSAAVISYKIISATTTPYIKVPLYIRAGLGHLIYYFDGTFPEDVYVKSFVTPIIGLRMRNYYFNKYIGIDGVFDFYFISFFTSRFDAAFDASVSFLYRFYTYKKISLVLRADLIGTFIIGNKKLENNLKLQFSFGMGLNEK